MQSVTLSPELTDRLTAEAERSGKTLSTLAEAWLRQQYQTLLGRSCCALCPLSKPVCRLLQ